jgi:flagellar basal-body rod modification protein FlgD
VYSTTGATASGQHDFSWNGEDSNGNQLADGVYKLAVTSKDAGGNAITTAIASKGVVSEVNLTSATPMLMVGNMAVPVSSVSAVDN